MDLYFLNKNFETIKVLDYFKNFAWNRKYYDAGNFSLEMDKESYKDLISYDILYIYAKEFLEIGKVEDLKIQKDTIIITGRFLEAILENRVVPTTYNKTGLSEVVAKDIALKYSGGLNLAIRSSYNWGTKIDLQVTGTTLKDTIYSILKQDGMSYKIYYEFGIKMLMFDVWRGKDRTENQNTNSWAVFSKNFENILDEQFVRNTSKYRNYCYVAGEGEGSSRTIVEINNVKTGEERKEMYVDARDLQQGDLTLNEYKNALKQRGYEKLAENNKVELAEFTVDVTSNLEYKKDFDLGDIVTYKNDDLDFYIENRIIGVSEIWNEGEKRVEATFGDDYVIKGGIR